MRRFALALGIGLLFAAIVGCETDQPLVAGKKALSIEMTAIAFGDQINIWDGFTESDPGSGDFDTPAAPRCLTLPRSARQSGRVPWSYVADLALIEAGGSAESTIASTVGNAGNPFGNQTGFDDEIISTLPNLTLNVPPLTFFTNGRRVRAGSRDYIETCLGINLTTPPDTLFGAQGSLELELNRGDTIVFRARKQRKAAAALASLFDPINGPFITDPRLEATVRIDGRLVEVLGEQSTARDDGAGFSFSVTLR